MVDLTPEEVEALRKMVWSAIRSRTADVNARLQQGWTVPEGAGKRLDFLSTLVMKLTPVEKQNGS